MKNVAFVQCQFERHANFGCMKYMEQLREGEKSFSLYGKGGSRQVAQIMCNFCLDKGEFIKARAQKLTNLECDVVHLLDCACNCRNGIKDSVKTAFEEVGLPVVENCDYK